MANFGYIRERQQSYEEWLLFEGQRKQDFLQEWEKVKSDPSISCDYELKKHIVTLNVSKNKSLELNLLSFRGLPAVYDLRVWRKKEGYDYIKVSTDRGVQLTAAELKILLDLLKDKDVENPTDENREPVKVK